MAQMLLHSDLAPIENQGLQIDLGEAKSNLVLRFERCEKFLGPCILKYIWNS